ncbi:hypothetical protein B0O80DRAFT_434960 [Mortierella sp. GBAus27b]|nr:hypothetical protein BGX31_001236 [Mortierella sp. GBA43]KAI8362055.1 hypothetical protein B0O80DRAFT_434960 [Mortierella sp. GBAus27b]
MRYQPNAPRKVIAVDLDEVLAKTLVAVAEFHNDTYGTSLVMDDFISYDCSKVWGGTREESIAKWRLFFDSPYFHKVEPVEGSLETLKLLKSRRYSLVIVTARQQFVADLTKKFVDRHYPGIFESIYFANHFLTEEEKRTFVSKPKSVICRDVHAQLLIDDSIENAMEVAKAGIPVLLFDLKGSYKWNKIPDGHPPLSDKITRVTSWKEIQAWFPRPRSPLSNLCLSRDDQISDGEEESESESSDDDQVDMEEQDHQQHLHQQQYQQRCRRRRRRRTVGSDSSSDEDDYDGEEEEDMDKDPMQETEGDVEVEGEGENEDQVLRRRKFMAMDFSSSDDEEDLERGENMDSDEQDFDLETGHGHHRRHRRPVVPHKELERLRHQHETMYTGDENGMEVETEVDAISTAKATMMTMESTTFTQLDGDVVHHGDGMIAVTTSTTMTTIMGSGTGTGTATTGQVSITAVQVESQSSLANCSSSTIPISPGTMVAEGLAIKRTMDMEEVPLA